MQVVGQLLERAARATPATVEDRSTGWWLRCTDTTAWWSGAVLAHGPCEDLDAQVDAAEQFYAGHAATTVFQVCPACPEGLDEVLARRGYRRQAPIELLTAELPQGDPAQVPGMTAVAGPEITPGWLSVLDATTDTAVDASQETRLLRALDTPQAFVTAFLEDVPAGVGRAVADDGWCGVFTMATRPAARRRGVGRLVLSALAAWARSQDSDRLYLQVEASNQPARRLYAAAGFQHLADYHYRVQPGRRSPGGHAP